MLMFDYHFDQLVPGFFNKERIGIEYEGMEVIRKTLLSAIASGHHPFSQIVESENSLKAIEVKTKSLRKTSSHLVVIGIGGSSLGAKMLCKSINNTNVFFLEGTDPNDISEKIKMIPWERSSVFIVSKSGKTLETLSLLPIVMKKIEKAIPQHWQKRTICGLSSRNSPLFKWAMKEGIETISIPETVGGRFSILSASGILPYSFAGGDLDGLIYGTKSFFDIGLLKSVDENPSLQAALLHFLLLCDYKLDTQILFAYSKAHFACSLWLQQLIAESIGKKEQGFLPVPASGSRDQHSILQYIIGGQRHKWITFLNGARSNQDPETDLSLFFDDAKNIPATLQQIQEALFKSTVQSVSESKIASDEISFNPFDSFQMGSFIGFSFLYIVYLSALLGVDPFSQPAVERGKSIARSLLIKPTTKKQR